MRDYVGTFWHGRYAATREFVVVDRRGDDFVMFELETETFHLAYVPSWGDTLWVHRFYHGEYFDNMTLEPMEPLKTQITVLG